LQALKNSFDDSLKRFSLGQSATIFQVVVAAIVLVAATGSPAFADEYGVEKEAPTLYTGETVEVCKGIVVLKPWEWKLSNFSNLN
jgi:hypothetical protein